LLDSVSQSQSNHSATNAATKRTKATDDAANHRASTLSLSTSKPSLSTINRALVISLISLLLKGKVNPGIWIKQVGPKGLPSKTSGKLRRSHAHTGGLRGTAKDSLEWVSGGSLVSGERHLSSLQRFLTAGGKGLLAVKNLGSNCANVAYATTGKTTETSGLLCATHLLRGKLTRSRITVSGNGVKLINNRLLHRVSRTKRSRSAATKGFNVSNVSSTLHTRKLLAHTASPTGGKVLDVKKPHLTAATLKKCVNVREFKLRVLRTIHLLGRKNLILQVRVSHCLNKIKGRLSGVNRRGGRSLGHNSFGTTHIRPLVNVLACSNYRIFPAGGL
jgi:hypothetical protein